MSILYIVVFSIILIFALVAVRSIIRRQKKPQPSPYTEALHLLLEGKNDQALEMLKKTVKSDTDNIMAYIKLGDIFREKGLPIRAAKIHRNLLIRNDLNDKQTETILHHLVLDYTANQNLDKAVEMAERLVQKNKKNIDYQCLLLNLYEKRKDWDKAYFYRQSINKWMKQKEEGILAMYKVKSGLSFVERHAEHEARIRFKEAIRLDKNCIPAYLYRGDSYKRDGRNSDAYNVWKDFALQNQDRAHLVFQRCRDVLFDMGRYGEIEDLYKQIIDKKPKNATVYIQLAELQHKQGNLDEAIRTCRNGLNVQPDFTRGQTLLLHLLQQKSRESEALDEAITFLNRKMEKETYYNCHICGYQSKEPEWHCPSCGNWDTFLKAGKNP